MPEKPPVPARVELTYAPRTGRRRRRNAAVLAALALAALVAFGAARWGKPAARKVRVLSVQRQCLEYTAPPERAVYRHEIEKESVRFWAPGGEVPARRDADWMCCAPPSRTDWRPSCLARLSGALARPPQVPGPVLFLHGRRSPAGLERLVLVAPADGAYAPDFDRISIEYAIVRPGRWSFAPPAFGTAPEVEKAGPYVRKPRPGVVEDQLHFPYATMHDIQVFAGQPDPADASHFTIRYESDGEENFIDGWLDDLPDGGTDLRLVPRPDPPDPALGASEGAGID